MQEVQKPPTVARKWFWLSLIANLLLLALAGGAILFALMLSYDLQDVKIRLAKEQEDKQRLESYLAESRARAAEVDDGPEPGSVMTKGVMALCRV